MKSADKMTVDMMSADDIIVVVISVYKMTVNADEMTVAAISLDKMTVDIMFCR